MKLILGLVWTLILHYSISSPLLGDGGQDKARKQTPELRLLGWIQDKVPELPITNFSQDWMNGKALGALVDGLAPGGNSDLHSPVGSLLFLTLPDSKVLDPYSTRSVP